MTLERDTIIAATFYMFTLQRALEWKEWDPEKVQRVLVVIIVILFLTGVAFASFSHGRFPSRSLSRNINSFLSFACEELLETQMSQHRHCCGFFTFCYLRDQN